MKALRVYTRITGSLIVVILTVTRVSSAYSVLTHEAMIDSAWEDSIKPILLRKYAASPAELKEARAYAYGGAIIQDMGYYPLGSKFFTDLTHYVRSGDFVQALLEEARDVNEYAFALGALAHYAGDNLGHTTAVNRAVPILYPKLARRFGSQVTYEDDPAAHIKTEFGFDVAQIARGRYLPDAYHDFIGFKVAKPALERAFKKTYGIDLKDIFPSLDLAIGTYRRAVSTVIPKMSRVAWETKKDDLQKMTPGITQDEFVYRVSPRSYEREWGREYDEPGVSEKVMAFFLRVVPKIGPLKGLAFKPPTPEVEKMFIVSFDRAVTEYRSLLGSLRRGKLNPTNLNCDIGRPTRAGEYELADRAYRRLLDKLAASGFRDVPTELRSNMLAFYSSSRQPATRKGERKWRDAPVLLQRLRVEGRSLPAKGQTKN